MTENNYTDAEYHEWLDLQNEAAYWEAMHRQIDECFIHAGRMSQLTDDMTAIANKVNPNKPTKYADFVIPF